MVLCFAIFIMLILVSQCMIMPDAGTTMQGQPLPLNPATVPGTPVPPPCPGWFC
jgi:hypothetical protein